MASVLMEASITSTTTSAPSTPTTVASPGPQAPLTPAPEPPQQVLSPPISDFLPAPPLLEAHNEEEERNDSDTDNIFENDPICQIMDLLNFSVVPGKPKSIFETPLPSGELMSKSQHLEEKNALLDLIKSQKLDLVNAQAEKLNTTLKVLETEKKMQKVAKIIAELHNLYGKFLKCLVILMSKGEGKNGEVLLTLGPFPSVQEVDKLLIMLSGLSNQFENDFENLSQTKKALQEVNNFLSDKAQSVFQSGPVLEETSGGDDGTFGDSSLCSEPSTLVIPEDDIIPLRNITNDVISFTTSNEEATMEPPVSEPVEMEVSDDTTTAFIPVPVRNPQNQNVANGRPMYTLVEYPKQLNLVGKKHGFDETKRALGWYCVCGQRFESMTLAKYHIRYFSANWKFLCKLCSRKYPGLNFLKLHMLRVHKIMYVGTNGCRYCPKNFQTSSELLTHLKIAHNEPLPPEVDHMTSSCLINETSSQVNPSPQAESSSTSSTSSQDANTQSVLVVHGTICACGKDFGSKDSLIAHIREEVEAHGQHFICSVCQQEFNHLCNLKSHFREKHGMDYQDYQERQYGCSNCDAMFGNYEELESHILSAHQVDQVPLSTGFTENTDTNSKMTFHIGPEVSVLNDGSEGTLPLEPPVITIED